MKNKFIFLLPLALLTACNSSNVTPIVEQDKYDVTTASWNWTTLSDDIYQATVTLQSLNGKTPLIIDAEVNSGSIISRPTCDDDGMKRYTATATYEEFTLTDYKDVVLPKKNHHFDNYGYNEEYHWKQCECGLCLEKESHTFGEYTQVIAPSYKSRGEEASKCLECDYTSTRSILSAEEWAEIKITRANNITSSLPTFNGVEDSYKYNLLDDAREIYDLLSEDELVRVNDYTYLVDAIYGHDIIYNANKPHRVDMDETQISYERDDKYGDVLRFNVQQDLQEFESANGSDTTYRLFYIDDFMPIPNNAQEVVFYMYSPQDIEIEFRACTLSQGSTALNPSSETYQLEANKWNTIVLQSGTLRNFKTQEFNFLKIVFHGTIHASNEWRMSSWYCTKQSPMELVRLIDKLPAIKDLQPYDGGSIDKALKLYEKYDESSRALINNYSKLVETQEAYYSKNEVILSPTNEFNVWQYPNGGVGSIDSEVETKYGLCYMYLPNASTWPTVCFTKLKGFEFTKKNAVLYVKNYNAGINVYSGDSAFKVTTLNNYVSVGDGWNKYTISSSQLAAFKQEGVFNYNQIQFRFNEITNVTGVPIYISGIYGISPDMTQIISKIDALPSKDSFTMFDGPSIVGVKSQYDLLSTDEQDAVTNASKLLEVYNAYTDAYGVAYNANITKGGYGSFWGNNLLINPTYNLNDPTYGDYTELAVTGYLSGKEDNKTFFMGNKSQCSFDDSWVSIKYWVYVSRPTTFISQYATGTGEYPILVDSMNLVTGWNEVTMKDKYLDWWKTSADKNIFFKMNGLEAGDTIRFTSFYGVTAHQNVTDLINGLPEVENVTPFIVSKVNEINSLYNDLPASEKAKVTNSNKLLALLEAVTNIDLIINVVRYWYGGNSNTFISPDTSAPMETVLESDYGPYVKFTLTGANNNSQMLYINNNSNANGVHPISDEYTKVLFYIYSSYEAIADCKVVSGYHFIIPEKSMLHVGWNKFEVTGEYLKALKGQISEDANFENIIITFYNAPKDAVVGVTGFYGYK